MDRYALICLFLLFTFQLACIVQSITTVGSVAALDPSDLNDTTSSLENVSTSSNHSATSQTSQWPASSLNETTALPSDVLGSSNASFEGLEVDGEDAPTALADVEPTGDTGGNWTSTSADAQRSTFGEDETTTSQVNESAVLEKSVTMETTSNATRESQESSVPVEDTTWLSSEPNYDGSDEVSSMPGDSETVSTDDLTTYGEDETTTATVNPGGVISVAAPSGDKPPEKTDTSARMSTTNIVMTTLVTAFAVALVVGCIMFGVRLYRVRNRQGEPDLVHVRNDRTTPLA